MWDVTFKKRQGKHKRLGAPGIVQIAWCPSSVTQNKEHQIVKELWVYPQSFDFFSYWLPQFLSVKVLNPKLFLTCWGGSRSRGLYSDAEPLSTYLNCCWLIWNYLYNLILLFFKTFFIVIHTHNIKEMHSLMNCRKENTLLTPSRTLELCQPPQSLL